LNSNKTATTKENHENQHKHPKRGNSVNESQRRQVSNWLFVESTMGDEPRQAKRVNAAKISREDCHKDGLLWLLRKLAVGGTAGDCALLLLTEFRERGQFG